MPLSASLEEGDAVLRFPYDERLRQLLRAIPGRRWDPHQRVWRIPLDADRAGALNALIGNLDRQAQVSDQLARALQRKLARRDRRECLLDLARPDSDWWLSFSTDAAPQLVAALLEHSCAYRLPLIERALMPLDGEALELIAELRKDRAALRLTAASEKALAALRTEIREHSQPSALSEEIELRRDRQGRRWVMLAAVHAPLGRLLAARAGLHALEGPAGTLGIHAADHDAAAIAELLGALEPMQVDPRVERWLAQATSWEGKIELDGGGEQPLFLLLGERARLPPPLRERARSVPGGASIDATLESWRLIETHLTVRLSGAARRCVAALLQGRPLPPAVLECSRAHEQPTFVLAPGHDPALLERFSGLAGAIAPKPSRRHAHEHAELPALRADPFCVGELDCFLDAHNVWVEPDALELLQQIREQHAQAAGIVALSGAHDAQLQVTGLAGQLKPFQRAGVAYLLERRRAFLADEQGLGKTIQAIAALEAERAYPAIVVCPASLKLNWRHELESWLPQRTVAIFGSPASPRADVTIVNYDIVARRQQQLCALQPRALVLDESHYCKNAQAKRTRAVGALAGAVADDGLILALTGTPVMNNPPELISQLRILGRLGEFGSGAEFSRRFKGPDAHLRLHWHLRARCFARRLKRDVLTQLPAKTRSVVPIELDNEPEYRLAEQDLIAWLQSQPLELRELNVRVAAALRAERLVRLNALKLLAARGKLQGALTWIHDFLSTGEPLVVFARHREIQQAVLERNPGALHVLGTDSQRARDTAVRRFQSQSGREGQLIVCSIEVAGQGLTLTRASNMVFLELDWTPAKHDQAEDRCHRIGQQNAVNAYYLLAADTVDETIAALLERKRAVIGAVTDGQEQDDGPLLDALVRELRAGPYRHLRAVA